MAAEMGQVAEATFGFEVPNVPDPSDIDLQPETRTQRRNARITWAPSPTGRRVGLQLVAGIKKPQC